MTNTGATELDQARRRLSTATAAYEAAYTEYHSAEAALWSLWRDRGGSGSYSDWERLVAEGVGV